MLVSRQYWIVTCYIVVGLYKNFQQKHQVTLDLNNGVLEYLEILLRNKGDEFHFSYNFYTCSQRRFRRILVPQFITLKYVR